MPHPPQTIYVDSERRLHGSHSDFMYNINLRGKYDRFCVNQIIIPKSFYLVNSTNNTFILNEGGDDFIITLDEGDYGVRSLATNVKTKLEASGAFTYTLDIPAPLAFHNSYLLKTFQLFPTSY